MLSLNWYRTCSNCSEAIPSTRKQESCMFRPILLTLVCGLLVAQQTPAPQSAPQITPQVPPPAAAGAAPAAQAPIPQPELKFTGDTLVVQAPVLVFDRDGNYVDGLQPFQFHLFDNGKEQNI